MGMGRPTGTGPWVRVPQVRVWVRVQDVKSQMKYCGYDYGYATSLCLQLFNTEKSIQYFVRVQIFEYKSEYECMRKS